MLKSSSKSKKPRPAILKYRVIPDDKLDEDNDQKLLVARNKHFPNISTYHGYWLCVPIDLFESLFHANQLPPVHRRPPVDMEIVRNLITIRKLFDEAIDLTMKASRSMTATSPKRIQYQDAGNGKVAAARQQRLHEMAVAKLAQCYRIDEIAASVNFMQNGSSVEDLHTKVLKRSPNNLDALYVAYFHDKIPSRELAANTPIDTLDMLIDLHPNTAEYYRTRALAYSFREDFTASLKDFKNAIYLTKTQKKKDGSCLNSSLESTSNSIESNQKKSSGLFKNHPAYDMMLRKRQSTNPVPDSIHGSEAMLYFLRASVYHLYAMDLIEKAIFKGMRESDSPDSTATKKKKKNGSGGSFPDIYCAIEEAIKQSTANGFSEDLKQGAPTRSAATFGCWRRIIKDLKPIANHVERSIVHIRSLARKSIRDNLQFLSFYPCADFLPVFDLELKALKPDEELRQMKALLHPSSPPELPAYWKKTVAEFQLMPSDSRKQELDVTKPRPILMDTMAPPSNSFGSLALRTVLEPSNSENTVQTQQQAVELEDKPAANGIDYKDIGWDDGLFCKGNSINYSVFHPLLFECWHNIMLNLLILGEWDKADQWHDHIIKMIGVVDEYPLFHPSRGMSQSDYLETLRLTTKSIIDDAKKKRRRELEILVARERGKANLDEKKPVSRLGSDESLNSVDGDAAPAVATASSNKTFGKKAKGTSQPNAVDNPTGTGTKRADVLQIYIEVLLGSPFSSN